jgi:hypothetical protein
MDSPKTVLSTPLKFCTQSEAINRVKAYIR